jgi:hypothetical protein
MRKTEQKTQQNGAPAARRRVRLKVLAVLAFMVALAALLAAGQRVKTMAQKDESLFNRIERSVKAKEPSWKLVSKNERKGAVQKYFNHGWKLGNDEYVSARTREMADAETAEREMAQFIRTPGSVPLRVDKVQGLGDEAYTLGGSPYGKKGAGTLVVRRGNIYIRLDSSSLQAAKRFARHMLAAVDAR